MTSLHSYGNSDLDKIHRTGSFGLSIGREWISISCMLYVAFSDLYLKLADATIEQSDRVTHMCMKT